MGEGEVESRDFILELLLEVSKEKLKEVEVSKTTNRVAMFSYYFRKGLSTKHVTQEMKITSSPFFFLLNL